MAYDTIKIKSPSMDATLVRAIENKCLLRSGTDMATGEILYELFTGNLLGSWDSRISVVPKYEDWTTDKDGRPRLHACEPYILVEASVHKVMLGHNVYGGPENFLSAARYLVALVEKLLGVDLPAADGWTVHRVDVANVYNLKRSLVKEFFDGIQLMSFPRRRKNANKYDMAIYFAGKTTTVKMYHKGDEFKKHDRQRLKSFFRILFDRLHGTDERNPDRVERKLKALQRLADKRLRVEVEIHADKFQYDLGHCPRVSELTDAYLNGVHDAEIERLLREGKQGMDTVRTTRAVLTRLQNNYPGSQATRLYGFWSSLTSLGDEVARAQYPKATFYRNRKALEDAGISWRGSDIVVTANDSPIHDFAPMRVDRRFCHIPARNRPEYLSSRDLESLAA